MNRPRARLSSPYAPLCVLIDGSALFLCVRALGEGRPLDYRAFVRLLCASIDGLEPPSGREDDETKWVMWTSATADNAGQNRFLEFAEKELLWAVRRVAPADSFMVDPATALGLTQDSRASSRLVRFDAAIAFAIGRMAESHRLVVVSDSFPLADPMQRAARLRGGKTDPNVLAFFGRAIDNRWQRLIRESGTHASKFVDLDDFEGQLFGAGKEVGRVHTEEDNLPF